MATRENQTMQILVITLLIVSLMLIGGLVWVNSNRKAAEARASTAESRASEAQSAQRSLQEEANRYKVWMGYAEADSSDTIEKTYNEDGERWGSTLEQPSRVYREMLRIMFEENRQMTLSEGDAKAQAKKLQQELEATEAEKDEQIKNAMAELQKVKADLASERLKFDSQYKEIVAKEREIAAQLDEQRNRYDEMVATNRTEKKELSDLIKKLERVIEVMKGRIPDPDPFAQPADGIVRWVNQRTGTVWINLGESDGLRPQVTFTIFSSDQDDALTSVQKATIEVTRILSAKMAEARITSDIATDPILEGDKIYSQIWNPGRQVSFAIAGIIDMDGDGRNDIDELKSVIRLSNGVVDASPGADGKVDGEITSKTRYLILGDFPEAARLDDERRSWDLMSKEADTYGVEPIQLHEFLQLIGWKSHRNTVPLGVGSEARDFPAEREDPAEYRPGKGTDIFRPRKPQAPY